MHRKRLGALDLLYLTEKIVFTMDNRSLYLHIAWLVCPILHLWGNK